MYMYIDDILITGLSEQEHLKNLNQVLTRLAEAGLKLKQTKCSFMQPHRLSTWDITFLLKGSSQHQRRFEPSAMLQHPAMSVNFILSLVFSTTMGNFFPIFLVRLPPYIGCSRRKQCGCGELSRRKHSGRPSHYCCLHDYLCISTLIKS